MESKSTPEIVSSETSSPVPQLPLAKELPPWDLVPPDTLLVRRRPASK
jgi:hypothetical protein